MTGQALLFRHQQAQTRTEDIVMFSCRLATYVGSMCPLAFNQTRNVFSDLRQGNVKHFCHCMLPKSVLNFHDFVRLLLMWLLIIMLTQEPFFWCLNVSRKLTMDCKAAVSHQDLYSCCAFMAMILFWLQLLDLTIFSMPILAYAPQPLKHSKSCHDHIN